MRVSLKGLVPLLAAGFCAAASATEEQPGTIEAGSETEIQVMDLVIISTNQVLVGTNAISLIAATNLPAARRATVDVVGARGSDAGEDPFEEDAEAMARITSVGAPTVVVEEDGEYPRQDSSGQDGIYSARVGTAQFSALSRLWGPQTEHPAARHGPTVQATVDLDTAMRTYELNQVAVGLFGEHVWIVHEQRDSDEGSGTIGLQLRTEW